jgi:hypothetical protein
MLISFSFLLEAKLKSISYKGLISLLTPSVANFWLLAYRSLSFTRACCFIISRAICNPFPFAFKDLITLIDNIKYTIFLYILLIEMLSLFTIFTQLPLIIGILFIS